MNSTTKQVKEFIRHPYAWPGGYPMFALTDDGAALCKVCCKSEWSQICWSMRTQESSGWRVIGIDINWEDDDLHCDHCSDSIAAAYGSNE